MNEKRVLFAFSLLLFASSAFACTGFYVGKKVSSDLFFAIGGQDPAGAISPAEFERIEIVDGIAYLGVAVYTNSAVKTEGEGWGVATNGVIEVPAPDKQGFFLLMSKGAEKEERAK